MDKNERDSHKPNSLQLCLELRHTKDYLMPLPPAHCHKTSALRRGRGRHVQPPPPPRRGQLTCRQPRGTGTLRGVRSGSAGTPRGRVATHSNKRPAARGWHTAAGGTGPQRPPPATDAHAHGVNGWRRAAFGGHAHSTRSRPDVRVSYKSSIDRHRGTELLIDL